MSLSPFQIQNREASARYLRRVLPSRSRHSTGKVSLCFPASPLAPPPLRALAAQRLHETAVGGRRQGSAAVGVSFPGGRWAPIGRFLLPPHWQRYSGFSSSCCRRAAQNARRTDLAGEVDGNNRMLRACAIQRRIWWVPGCTCPWPSNPVLVFNHSQRPSIPQPLHCPSTQLAKRPKHPSPHPPRHHALPAECVILTRRTSLRLNAKTIVICALGALPSRLPQADLTPWPPAPADETLSFSPQKALSRCWVYFPAQEAALLGVRFLRLRRTRQSGCVRALYLER